MATCFVIQPFDKGPYDKRYDDILKPAIIDAGLEPYRVDQDPSVSVPIDDIERNIRDAEICLADISTNNPNVWYEVGYAFANGKPVVLICAEPRLDPYPFDVRHRHVIPYATHSSSDFEKLKKDVASRLEAQLKKAEKLQTAVAIAQIKPTEGLTPHEMAVLLTITSGIVTPHGGMAPYSIQESMKRSGYTSAASTIALAGLQKKEMIEFYEEYDTNNDRNYTACKLTGVGLTWMLDNQDQFRLRTDDEIEFVENGKSKIKDEDIPF
jgi:hypothetical protein